MSHRFEILLALTNIASLSDELREFMVENEVGDPNQAVVVIVLAAVVVMVMVAVMMLMMMVGVLVKGDGQCYYSLMGSC